MRHCNTRLLWEYESRNWILHREREGSKTQGERERFVHQRFSVFSGQSLCLPLSCHCWTERKKEEGIWFHRTLLPFDCAAVADLHKPSPKNTQKQPQYLSLSVPLSASLQDHYIETHKWVRHKAILIHSNPTILASSSLTHLDGLKQTLSRCVFSSSFPSPHLV